MILEDVDLAVEIPLPDAQAREHLLRLYSGSMRLGADLAPVVEATEGVTASYIKELLRRAVLAAFRVSGDARSLTDADLAVAVGELSAERQALTRSLIGQPRAGGPDEWPDLDDDDEDD